MARGASSATRRSGRGVRSSARPSPTSCAAGGPGPVTTSGTSTRCSSRPRARTITVAPGLLYYLTPDWDWLEDPDDLTAEDRYTKEEA
jgi:hypothetical protein